MTNTYGSLENRTDNHHLLVKKILSTEEFLTKNMKLCINHLLPLPPPKKNNPWLKWMENLSAFTEEIKTNILKKGVEKREINNINWETF